MQTLTTRFRAILSALQAAIARVAPRNPARTTRPVMGWGDIGRLAMLFESLVADWRAGILPMPGSPEQARERPSMQHPAAGALASFQEPPDAAASLTETPRARRLPRPRARGPLIAPPPEPIADLAARHPPVAPPWPAALRVDLAPEPPPPRAPRFFSAARLGVLSLVHFVTIS